MQEKAILVTRHESEKSGAEKRKVPAGPDLSIVIPVYNSENTIGVLIDQLQSLLKGRLRFEIVLVNDDSVDRSLEVLMDVCNEYDNVKVLDLSKNFGEQNAVIAGLNYVRGAYVITMDDDLQNPAEEVLKLIAEAQKGYDVVYAQYIVKRQSFLRNLGSEINNLMAYILIKKPKGMKLNSFRIIKSYVVKEVIKYQAPYPYIDGLILRVTRSIGTVTVEHKDRKEGRSNYTIRKLVGLWLNGFFNFSITPLRCFIYAGIILACLGLSFAVVTVIDDLFFSSTIPGWTSLITATMVFSGVQLLSIGMIGEYIGRIFLTQNLTPQFVIKNLISNEGPDE